MAPSIIGVSKHIENIKILINKIAKTEENVLVLGEKGVGKDLVLQNLYYRSKRVGVQNSRDLRKEHSTIYSIWPYSTGAVD